MAAPTNHWKLGLFVVIGFVLVLTTVAALGARSLRTEVGHYVSYFDESVQGLEIGSPLKFRGGALGTLGKIDIAPEHPHAEGRRRQEAGGGHRSPRPARLRRPHRGQVPPARLLPGRGQPPAGAPLPG